MKAKKWNKVILSFVLSAALMVEPLAGIPIVYAEEAQTEECITDNDEDFNEITPDNQKDTDGSVDRNEPGDSDTHTEIRGENDNAQEEDSDVESGEDKEDSSREESGEDKEDDFQEEGNNQEEGETEEVTEEEGNLEEETEEPEEVEEETEKEEVEEEEKQGTDLDNFSDMPSEYKLTSFQKELKAELSKTLNQLSESDEGVTYAERQIFTFVDSQEEAEMIAKAYHAEIIDFQMGVLTMKLGEGKSVKSAVLAAADMDNNLPAVWPNYSRQLHGEIGLSTEDESISDLEVVEEEYSIDDTYPEPNEEEIPTLETYEQVLNELDGFSDEYLKPTEERYQWFHTTVGSPYAWDAGYMGDSVKVGVIDSGVDSNPDLDDNVYDKKDFCDGTDDAADYLGHGTHVAGIIAALGNGSKGVGVAPKAQIFNARVFGSNGSKSGQDSTIIAAINYLIGEENNASDDEVSSEPARVDIINMSLGGPGDDPAFQLVLDKAYKKGVIVFASTGNDGGSLMMYPAAYNHVIGVSATDTNNQRAYFSNYGSATDLSAPGVNIYSTVGTDYGSKAGTSMACPVAAGEAAVILSGQDALPTLKGKTGKARVDALESIMKSNTISVGSGMGKGITSLPKVFKLSTAAAKPNAPTITSEILEEDDKQFIEVTITAQTGMKLCYTTNGKNPVWKNEETDADTTLVEDNTLKIRFDCTETAKGTVKAFAINASGLISSVKSYSFAYPYVININVSGPQRVEQGKSIQLAAAVTPTSAANKKVTWEIKTAVGAEVDTTKIKIDQKGKVTATKDADIAQYKVTVTAKDDKHVSKDYIIGVVATGTAIQSLAFDKNTSKELWITASASNPTLPLAPALTAADKSVDGQSQNINGSELGDRVTWTSSKPAVATIDDNGEVTAKAAGTTTITAKANDSGGKKATINITVKQAITGITITTGKGETDANFFTVAAGKSTTLKAVIIPSKPANKKVIWELYKDDKKVDANFAKEVGVSISTGGKVTASKYAQPGIYTVRVTAADGKNATAAQQIKVVSGAIGGITWDDSSYSKAKLYTKSIDSGKSNTKTISATIRGANGATDFDPDAYTVTSGNPSVVQVSNSTRSGNTVTITLTATGNGYGKTNVVIASTDGSNKKATCAVTVSGGIKKAELFDTLDSGGKKVSKVTLFRNGTTTDASLATATLYAKLTGSDGANTDAYTVTSSNPNLVRAMLSKSSGMGIGTINLTASSNSTGKATITLTATDGSKKKATCTVTVCNPPSKINIAPKNGEMGCVVPGKSVQMTATLETEYGVVSNKNVEWSLPESVTQLGIRVNSSGKISVPANFAVSARKDYKVTATAKDGSGISATGTFYVAPPTSYIKLGNPSQAYGIYRVAISSDCTTPMSCSSSSPKVASPTISYTAYDPSSRTGGTGTITFICTQRGSATFTIKALDGSGKQYKYKIIVK